MKNILLHTCCGPCFTGSFGQLKDDFNLTILWYNPNIEPISEHDKRLHTLREYCEKANLNLKIISDYDYAEENQKWHEAIAGFENEPEGGSRCEKCFGFRLTKMNELLLNDQFDLGSTTLTISPFKNAELINKIGAEINPTKFLILDLKKAGGYQRSIEISKEFDLYRQKYCGCQYSQKSI